MASTITRTNSSALTTLTTPTNPTSIMTLKGRVDQFSKLPTELHLCVGQFLPRESIHAMSCTSKHLFSIYGLEYWNKINVRDDNDNQVYQRFSQRCSKDEDNLQFSLVNEAVISVPESTDKLQQLQDLKAAFSKLKNLQKMRLLLPADGDLHNVPKLPSSLREIWVEFRRPSQLSTGIGGPTYGPACFAAPSGIDGRDVQESNLETMLAGVPDLQQLTLCRMNIQTQTDAWIPQSVDHLVLYGCTVNISRETGPVNCIRRLTLRCTNNVAMSLPKVSHIDINRTIDIDTTLALRDLIELESMWIVAADIRQTCKLLKNMYASSLRRLAITSEHCQAHENHEQLYHILSKFTRLEQVHYGLSPLIRFMTLEATTAYIMHLARAVPTLHRRPKTWFMVEDCNDRLQSSITRQVSADPELNMLAGYRAHDAFNMCVQRA